MKLADLNILEVGHTIQLAGAIYADGRTVFLVPLPDALTEDQELDLYGWTATHGLEHLDMDQEDWQRFIRQTDLLETEILNAAGDNGKLVKAIVRKSARQISQGVSWAVYRRDGYECRYCGRDEVPLTVDHLILWEEGGPSIEENLVASCRKCNKTRGNMQYGDWLESPYYKRVRKATSQNPGLSIQQRFANDALLSTLDGIERVVHKHTKR